MDTSEMAAMIELYVIPWGIKIVLALAIFYVGRMVVSSIVKLVSKLLRQRDMDEILVSFLSSILRWVLLLFVIIAALSQLGINTNSLVALLGAAGLAIGLSLQSSLSNFASGVMLIIFRPFTKGDFVEAGGATGVVDNISIFTTTMTTTDNKEIIVPNGAILGGNITNYSARPTRRVDMVFGISYDDDLRKDRPERQSVRRKHCLKVRLSAEQFGKVHLKIPPLRAARFVLGERAIGIVDEHYRGVAVADVRRPTMIIEMRGWLVGTERVRSNSGSLCVPFCVRMMQKNNVSESVW